MEVETSVAARSIKIYSTSGTKTEIESSATTWSELKKDLNANNIAFKGLKAQTSTQVTLELGNAQLPNHKFVLFLTPQKTKSGMDYSNMAYKDCRATIKSILDAAGAKDKTTAAYLHFNDGKNYTIKGTAVMREMLASWSGNTPVQDETVPVLETVVESVKESKVEVAPIPKQVIQKVVAPVVQLVDPKKSHAENLETISKELAKIGKAVNGTPNLLIVGALNNLYIAASDLKANDTSWDEADKMAEEMGIKKEPSYKWW
jgi:hypothetical protein